MERESFVFYRSFYEAAETLADDDRVLLYDMISGYGLNGITPEPCQSPAYGMFLLIKPQLDANLRKYINGAKGGRPKKPKQNLEETYAKPKHNLDVTYAEPNVNVNDNDNVNVNINSRAKTKRFYPPTVQEVRDYVTEKGYPVAPERFVDFYESKGWMVGKSKMKDWKAAVRNWASRDKKDTPGKYEQRHTDYDAMLANGYIGG